MPRSAVDVTTPVDVARHLLPNAVGPEQTDAPCYFLHIPRTAGSTLAAFLHSLFLDSQFWHRGRERSWESLLKLSPEELRHCQIINGHFGAYFFKLFPLALRYFTFLRDPLARAVSHHEHVLRDKSHYFHTLAKELGTFGAYLRDERTQPTIVNFQLRCIGATFDPVRLAESLTADQMARLELERRLDTMPVDQPLGDLLQSAGARLDQMCFVGLTERFAESLSLLCEVFGWPRPATTEAHNVNPRTMTVKDLASTDLRLLKRLNEADIELYQLAKARFERDWARSRFVYPQLHAFVSYAQNTEDVLLYRALRTVDQGTYVDVGANDPAGDSVTKAFYDRGWRGINIEPVTSLYQALVKHRPEDVNIQAAAGTTDGEKTLYEIPGTGLSTLDADIAGRHRRQGFKVNETSVRVRTLRSILAETPRSDIHFLKIDVEGWEREVLQGMDLVAIRPWIVVVEATEPNTEIPSYRDWERLLLNHGYSFVFFDGLNRYYLAREKQTLKKAFSRPVNCGDVFIRASEASAVHALRDTQWSLQKQATLVHEQTQSLAAINRRVESAEGHVHTLEQERDALKQELAAQTAARATEHEEGARQIEALTQWATTADTYGKSLVGECEKLRAALQTISDAREVERTEGGRQIEALTKWATSAETYGKSLIAECERLRVSLQSANDARETERTESVRQVVALTERAALADARAQALTDEREGLRASLKSTSDSRETERAQATQEAVALAQRAALADARMQALTDECEGLRASAKSAGDARETERAEATRDAVALAQRAALADARTQVLTNECETLRASLNSTRETFEVERDEATQQLVALKERAASTDAHAKALADECGRLRASLTTASQMREAERTELMRQVVALTERAASANAFGKSLADECERLRASVSAANAAAVTERAEAMRQVVALTDRAAIADTSAKSLTEELTESRERWQRESAAHRAELEFSQQAGREMAGLLNRAQERADSLRLEQAKLQDSLREERESRILEQADARKRDEYSQAQISTLERELATNMTMRAELDSEVQHERNERQRADITWGKERITLETKLHGETERAQRAEAKADAVDIRFDALMQDQKRSLSAWQSERNDLRNSLTTLERYLTALQRHWAVRMLVNKRYLQHIQPENNQLIRKRKIGVFTICSKNYLAYARVLLKSIAAVHPEYSLYLCLVDKVDGEFDPAAESFRVIESDGIGIPHFDDMALRYDIMEFNTAVKPFMFQWLMDNTDLDSIIYIDPDIRVYSRFNELEAVLASDVSMVLTPHITNPIEDGKNPNDYHMLQAGVFNLGFAAINRCDEARHFVEWWGRRLETQACADLARNLFTDQRWCDLAPCFLNRLHVFKRPGYNVAYWNLTERTLSQVSGQWRVNGEPLAFFHFSGINVANDNVVSKHQNRFEWDDLPTFKPLFDDYRSALLEEGWEQTKGWSYAYAKTNDGKPIPSIVRRLYRETYPSSQALARANVSERLRDLCNSASGAVPSDSRSPITSLMEMIYRQRPDLQAAFNLGTREGRVDFQGWYKSAAHREYNLPAELIPEIEEVEPATAAAIEVEAGAVIVSRGVDPPMAASITHAPLATANTSSISDLWCTLPTGVKRLLAPAVRRMLTGDVPLTDTTPTRPTERANLSSARGGRIDALRDRAPLPQLLDSQRYISVLMHMVWRSRADLRAAFDLNTAVGQVAYAGWFEASAQREYGIDGGTLDLSDASGANAATPSEVVTKETHPGANLIGYAHAELGMGEHVRMSAAALKCTDVEFAVVNFNVGVASRQEATLDHGHIAPDNPFAANIFHVNADQMFVAYRHLGHDFFINRYNIGYWAWELAKCPDEFRAAAHMVDEIWAPSRFIQQAFAEGSDIPVEYMPLCVTLPEFKRLDRRRFGLPERACIFLYTFDFFSYLERKNPFAAIRAFKLAFPERRSDVCLVLKIMNGKDDSPLWRHMMELIDADPRIVVINQTLSRSEVLALLDVCDSFVSLHRSEGFGRGPAEAMYLGKPVIVTNYSGNTDFTLVDNSCLVEYTLVPVEEGQYPFHHGQEWADASIEHAAWHMNKLHSDSSYAREVGAKGRAYILENFSQEKIGARYESRLKQLALA